MLELNKWPHVSPIIELAKTMGELEVWIFGSALKEGKTRDLDILVVYTDSNQARVLRHAVTKVDPYAEPPIDIIFLRPAEEAFYDFIKTTSAIRIV